MILMVKARAPSWNSFATWTSQFNLSRTWHDGRSLLLAAAVAKKQSEVLLPLRFPRREVVSLETQNQNQGG